MGNFLFRLLLTFNATSLLVIIFLIKEGISLETIFPSLCPYIEDWPNAVSYAGYILIPVILTGISIKLSSYLSKDNFVTTLNTGTQEREKPVLAIDHANNSFLPSYLGYFFVALSINNQETLLFVYGILFVFTFLSQALYFNPLFLLFKYEFYNITTRNGAVLFLISRECYKVPDDVELEEVFRINNYTFIEKGI